ncbi:hypothetical protein NXX56_04820 [Bacteroides thetaiotaomicron]|nr:hypothetical protein [Bacteroides thetaiotaomicron]
MKRNLLYLAGFLLAAATVFSGCNDDDPSYHDLVPNTQELIINLDETPGRNHSNSSRQRQL